MLFDAHMHLDLMEQPDAYAQAALSRGEGMFSCTVTPTGFEAARLRWGGLPGVCVGLGLHPWWLAESSAQAQAQVQRFLELLPGAPFVGEVGLDFAPAHVGTQVQQCKALLEVLYACARAGDKVISLHCVRAYGELLGMLHSTQVAANNTCIIHWFSGPHDALLAALDAGCWFSVGERLLSTKRGRAYLQDIPANRLLLETDAPPEGDGLQAAFDAVAALRGQEVAQQACANGFALFG
ncbi:MAG: TatD family hydrolase [Coriobacteriia bacterium]|nr:TatD family hydrolase [Coriobacteriia bacterium]